MVLKLQTHFLMNNFLSDYLFELMFALLTFGDKEVKSISRDFSKV